MLQRTSVGTADWKGSAKCKNDPCENCSNGNFWWSRRKQWSKHTEVVLIFHFVPTSSKMSISVPCKSLNFWIVLVYAKNFEGISLEVFSTKGCITFDQWSFQETESWCLVHLYWTKQWNTLISTLFCSHEITNNWSSHRILALCCKNIMTNKENKWCDEI